MRMANECLRTKRPKHPQSVTVLHVPGPAQSRERVSACRSDSLLTFAASSYSTESQSVPILQLSPRHHLLPAFSPWSTDDVNKTPSLPPFASTSSLFLLLSRLPSFKLFPDCKDLGEEMTNFLKVKKMES